MSVAAPPLAAEVVLRGDIQLGESPVWSEVDNVLYFVDIDGKAVHSYDPSDGRHFRVATPAKAAAVRTFHCQPAHADPQQPALAQRCLQ